MGKRDIRFISGTEKPLRLSARVLEEGASQTVAGTCSMFPCLLACSSGDSVTGTGFSFPETMPIFSRCVIALVAAL